ncbi:OmpA family protein [Janibacter sp. YB324]|uniref:OmpA family protein n=1 Tax=Janibacter sp. YB324 TaxID=2761047 RepID=UPI001625C7F2|nr:OmpA family protein [Janibacter sp. YB324]QNF94234.1 OmpA family protein [Janibacter sp. YB324]
MTTRTRGRILIAATIVAPFVVVGASTAGAVDDEPLTSDTLPTLSDSEVNEHRSPIDVPEVDAIDVPDIDPFEPEVTTSGGSTVVTLDTDVLFEFAEAELGESAQEAVAEAVADVPDGAKVTVVGHTDSVGSDAANLKLSKERAQAVADVIEDERDDLELDVSGKGEKDPVADNDKGGEDNPEGREKNRRVEIRYQG